MTTPKEVLLVGSADESKGTLELPVSPVRPAGAMFLKRAIDVMCACLGMLVLAPLLVLVAIFIKPQDGGPVFHRRRVVGPGVVRRFKFPRHATGCGRGFRGEPEAQEQFQRNFKLENDHRITPLGGLLRKYSIDELPQLWNVLLGQMSLVGPRMITAEELQKYGDYQPILLSVLPGLTGYWQVNGRQSIDYARRVQMDIYYIENWTLMFDLRILLQTPRAVLKATGAL
jgi:lipopolysaccharide/colanic/teichoic acid biosynthesis glycosyltransferase